MLHMACGMNVIYLHLLHFKIHIECMEHMMTEYHIDGLVQDCSNSSAIALELLQSCTKHQYDMCFSSASHVSFANILIVS